MECDTANCNTLTKARTTMALLYEANRVEWKTGDYVVHDSDAKRTDMLMVVIGRSRAGGFRTRYVFPFGLPRSWRRRVWLNTIEALHDPRRFGIELPTHTVASFMIHPSSTSPTTILPQRQVVNR